MNIVIDARWIFHEISGIGEYTRQLLRYFALLERRHDYTLLFCDEELLQRTRRELELDTAPHMRTLLVPHTVFSPLGQLRVPGVLRGLGAEIFHSTNYMMPLSAFPRRGPRAIRAVVTIHDVIPLLFRDHAPRSRKARLFPLYRALMREIARRADRIITVSAASGADIAETLGLTNGPAGKIRPIHNGVSGRFRPPPHRLPRDQAEERSILYVGRSDPYKNLPLLIEAVAAVRRRLPFPVRLVIAGARDARYPEADAAATRLGVAGHVHWTGYVTDDALVRLYQDADVLVHPSRYEGFGLQVVEAMACGLPVICSRAGALPEVAGDAALLVPPDDGAGFADAIARVLTDPDLAADLGNRGRVRATAFTWRKAAEKTLAVYAELAAPGGVP